MTRLSIIMVGALGVVLLTAVPAFADVAYPAVHGLCVDTTTNVVGDDMCGRITDVLQQDEARYGDQIAVAVVPTTGGTPIEAWATGLFNAWGVGQAGKDDGVLLVVAVDDHQLRIATGRGMAGRLSDGSAGEIINATITPAFKQDRYAAGILAGLDEIRRHLGHEVTGSNALTGSAPGDLQAGVPAPGDVPARAVGAASGAARTSSNPIGWVAGLVGVGALVLVVLWLSTMRGRGAPAAGTRSRSVWLSGTRSEGSGSAGYPSSGGVGGVGGSSGFGGGGSDGGGSSGSW